MSTLDERMAYKTRWQRETRKRERELNAMSAQLRCAQTTRTKTTTCDFCHVQIDGTAYRVGIFRYHKVCLDVQREKGTAGTPRQTPKIGATAPFRMRTFSGSAGLKLMQGGQPWTRVA